MVKRVDGADASCKKAHVMSEEDFKEHDDNHIYFVHKANCGSQI